MAALLEAIGTAPFVFVVGKGGVGKTTAAGALAVQLAGAGRDVHLISTDPAHSLADLFAGEACSRHLTVEEFDAAGYAAAWLERVRDPLTELIERGTYLDADDVAAFTNLALPGVDELMAAMRLVDLAAGTRPVIVDTAPTGHTLRLLDAASVHEGMSRALQRIAEKAAVVASSLAGRRVRFRGETLIEELDAAARTFRVRVLGDAAFVVAARSGAVVEAETRRIVDALRERRLRVAGTIWMGLPGRPPGDVCLQVPALRERPAGCNALRAWSAALAPCAAPADPGHDTLAAAPGSGADASPSGTGALAWLRAQPLRLWLVAGKGGVGKTTCAAALAISLAADRDVLLCSADPAGSLGDVLGASGTEGLRLRTRQIDAAAELHRLRSLYEDDVAGALASFGLGDAAVLDRRVVEALWDLAPPGIDEIAALVALLDVAGSDETIVLDTAPTGHFLRLIAMPALALDWTHQLMRLIVKYGAAGSAGGAADSLLRLARQLHALEAMLRDDRSAGALLVTLPEPMVRAETERLRQALRDAGVPVVAVIENRAGDASRHEARMLRAPELPVPPVGARALREFATTWNIVT